MGDLRRWCREPAQAGAGLVREEEEVTITATLYPGVGMASWLVPEGLDGMEVLAWAPPLRAGMGSSAVPTGVLWDLGVQNRGCSLGAMGTWPSWGSTPEGQI